MFLKFTCSQQQKDETLWDHYRARDTDSLFQLVGKRHTQKKLKTKTNAQGDRKTFFSQLFRLCCEKKGTEQNGKKVKRGARRLWESFHHWVFCQSPTARHSFANCLGEGGASCWVPSRGCQYEEIWGDAKWAVCMKNNWQELTFQHRFFFSFLPLLSSPPRWSRNAKKLPLCWKLFPSLSLGDTAKCIPRIKKTKKNKKQELYHCRWPPRVLLPAMTQIKETPAAFCYLSVPLSPLSANFLPAGGRSSRLIAYIFLKCLLFISFALHHPCWDLPGWAGEEGGGGGEKEERRGLHMWQAANEEREYLPLCCSCLISAEIWLIHPPCKRATFLHSGIFKHHFSSMCCSTGALRSVEFLISLSASKHIVPSARCGNITLVLSKTQTLLHLESTTLLLLISKIIFKVYSLKSSIVTTLFHSSIFSVFSL